MNLCRFKRAVPGALHFLQATPTATTVLEVSPAVIGITPVVVADMPDDSGTSPYNNTTDSADGAIAGSTNPGGVGAGRVARTLALRQRVRAASVRAAAVRASIEIFSRDARRPVEVPMVDDDADLATDVAEEEARRNSPSYEGKTGGGGGGVGGAGGAPSPSTFGQSAIDGAVQLPARPHLFRRGGRQFEYVPASPTCGRKVPVTCVLLVESARIATRMHANKRSE